jgi:hypothetical protein
LSAGTKEGKTLDVYFEKSFNGLFSDPFVEPEAALRVERSKTAKKALAGPWRPNNPPERPTGPGSQYGLMGKIPEYEPHYRVPMPGETTEHAAPPPPRNFFTSPPRKGGPGTRERFIGKEPPGYVGEPAKDVAAQREKERMEAKKKLLAGPFKSMVAPPPVFDANKIYEPAPEIKRKKSKKKRQPAEPKPLGGPWKCTPDISGRYYLESTFTPFPTYETDPVEVRERKAKERDLKLKPLAGPFNSTHRGGTLPSKPIIRPTTSKY